MSSVNIFKQENALNFEPTLIQKVDIDDDGSLVIYGIGSAEVVDTQNEIVKMEALEKSLPQLLLRQTVSFEHRDTTVGKILERHKVGDYFIKTKVDYPDKFDYDFFNKLNIGLENKKYLFIVAKIFNDNDFNKSVIQKITKGIYNMFSIAGHKIKTSYVCDKKNCYTSIDDLTLDAVTITTKGANPLAFFKPINEGGIIMKDDVKVEEPITKTVEEKIETPNFEIFEKRIKEMEEKLNKFEAEKEIEKPVKKEIKEVVPDVPLVVEEPDGFKIPTISKEDKEEIVNMLFEKLQKMEKPEVIDEDKKIPLAKVPEVEQIKKSIHEEVWEKLEKIGKIQEDY
jgi:hypothetical protein